MNLKEIFDLISASGSLKNEYVPVATIQLRLMRRGYEPKIPTLRSKLNDLARKGYLNRKTLRMPLKERIWSSKLVAVVGHKRCLGFRRTPKGRKFIMTNSRPSKCPECGSDKIASCPGGTGFYPTAGKDWICQKCMHEF
ncbi:MAG: hypothetical protein GTN38_02850 [Candidatus Aenigmarchaeota archaeon]|nr:hypothetical protein [Candidatus Aenigmarchaeota archaeon]NIP40582.1 hypothetical protein [Candidatus Aenigmarchaeota archaeon]NIQ18579.1 hypothetical protein [Candidatus Aenigmarchaeota archaeon]